MTIPFDIDSNFLNTHTESMLGDLSMDGAFARSDPSPALRDQTYVTNEDNTAALPNSDPLALKATGFLASVLGTGVLATRVLQETANQIVITNPTGEAGNPVFSLSATLQLPGSLKAGGTIDTADNDIINSIGNSVDIGEEFLKVQNKICGLSETDYIQFDSGENAIYFYTNDVARFGITDAGMVADSPFDFNGLAEFSEDAIFNGESTFNNNVSFNNNETFDATFNLNIQSFFNIAATFSHAIYLTGPSPIISATTGNKLTLETTEPEQPIELLSDSVRIYESLARHGQTTNNVSFGNATQTYNIGGVSIFDLSASGFRLGAGARINNIDNTGTSFLTTDGVTAFSVQTMIAAALDAGVSFRGAWDASTNLFPVTGGTGVAGAIDKGNWWYITVPGTLNGQGVVEGDWITALVDLPGQTGSNWLISYQGVTSVFGRVGPIVATAGDYTFDKITGLPTTATTGKLMRGNGSAWAETTSTFADTYSLNTILFAGSANAVSGLTTTASSVLASSAAGLPNWLALTDGKIVIGSSSGAPLAANISSGTAINVTNGANTITITNTAPDQTVVLNSGTGISATGTYPNFTITNTDLGSSVTLANAGIAGGTTSLVNDGVGPALGIKGIVSGTNIAVTTNTTDTTIAFTGTLPIANGGTNNNAAIGADGTLAKSDGSKITFTTATYPPTAGASGNILTSDGTNIVSAAPAPPGITWNVVTGTSATAVAYNGYIANNAGLVTVTLPSTVAVGVRFAVTGINNATGWKLAVASGQTIYLGTAPTTTSTGYLASTNTRDSVEIVCVVANTTFNVVSSVGNITAV